MEQFTAGIFFDNDKDHIEHVGYCSGITCVKVGAIEDTGKNLVSKFPDYVGFYELLSDEGQDAYDELAQSGLFKQEEYDKLSGIQAKHVQICKAWLEKTNDLEKRVALFDFDRTLTLFEGLDPAVIGVNGVTVEGLANYLFGGTRRANMLKEMITELSDKGVSIKVLTNNGLCGHPIQLVERIAKTLHPDIEFICSRPDNSLPRAVWPHAKLIKLIKDARFHSICPTPEALAEAAQQNAGRRKRTAKNRRNKKLTRRYRNRR
jgi:hypothetical protein